MLVDFITALKQLEMDLGRTVSDYEIFWVAILIGGETDFDRLFVVVDTVLVFYYF